VCNFSLSLRNLRVLGASAVNEPFKYPHRGAAEIAEVAQRISNYDTTKSWAVSCFAVFPGGSASVREVSFERCYFTQRRKGAKPQRRSCNHGKIQIA
jgi:hypothetical protein